MTNVKQLVEYTHKKCNEYPNLESEISDLVDLCFNEIDEGNSIQGEIDNCVIAIEQLIEENA